MIVGLLFIKNAKKVLEKHLKSGEIDNKYKVEIIIRQLGEIIGLLESSIIETEEIYRRYKEIEDEFYSDAGYGDS